MTRPPDNPVAVGAVVGVAGGSGAGKTTLVRQLAAAFGDERVLVIAHDAYYRDRASLSPEARAQLNYDHPDALETSLLVHQLRALRRGRAVELPRYDFARHVRVPSPLRVEPRRLVLVDGVLVLSVPELRRHLDLSIFVHAPEPVRLRRRVERDVRERGRTPDSVEAQFRKSVGPMHARYVEPSRSHADVVVHGDADLDRDADWEALLGRIEALID